MTGTPGLTLELLVSPGVAFPPADALVRLVAFAGDRLGLRGEVAIWVCSDVEIAELHRDFMGIEGPTDVMSFPGEAEHVGDIAVSAETAAEQARAAGWSTQREIAYLALHGLLHLAGYDDLDPSSRQAMLARQDALLADFERESLVDWQ